MEMRERSCAMRKIGRVAAWIGPLAAVLTVSASARAGEKFPHRIQKHYQRDPDARSIRARAGSTRRVNSSIGSANGGC
jgi:hypothetical protein